MKRPYYIILVLFVLCTLRLHAQTTMPEPDTVIVPGVEYLLRNVGSGLYLTRSGAMVANEADADSWRFLDATSPTKIHSNRIFMYMYNGGFTSWQISLSGDAGEQEFERSTTSPKAFKFRCK